MKKIIVLKIVCIIFVVISISVFVKTNIILSDTYDLYNETYYLQLIVIEVINIIFWLLFFRTKKITNKYIITYLVFLLIIFCIPIYHNGNTYAPTGPNSYLMGLAADERYLNIYGINIIELVNILK